MKSSILTLALITLIHSLAIGQIISTSKDSLLIVVTEYSYTPADTFYLYNKGESLLTVDSIKTEHAYSYQVEINFSDTTVYFNLINFEPIEDFNLSPNDSARIIFSDPDLCPFCNSSNDYVPFTDSVTFYSNSIVKPQYMLAIFGDGYTGIKETETTVIDNFKLYQNYPNPFGKSAGVGNATIIEYSVPAGDAKFASPTVRLNVYDALGREVATLVNKEQAPGKYSIRFNAASLPSGIYFYRLTAGNFVQTQKMVLVR